MIDLIALIQKIFKNFEKKKRSHKTAEKLTYEICFFYRE